MRKYAAGVGSLLAIGATLVVVPIALLAIAGNPFPTIEQLQNVLTFQPDYGNVILVTKVLPLIAWVAWAWLAVPLLFEIGAAVIGRTVHHRPAAIRVQQRAATRLIAAIVIMFTASAGATIAQPTPAAAIDDSLAEIVSATSIEIVQRDTQADSSELPSIAVSITHIVAPGESLWTIAESYYGDGARNHEIFDASTAIVQSDGAQLTDPDLIRPGWTLVVPEVLSAARAPTEPAVPSVPDASSSTESSSPAPAIDNARGERGLAPFQEKPGYSTPSPTADRTDNPAEEFPWLGVGGAAGLLAAGLLGLLANRRLMQRRSRGVCERIAMPDGQVQELEMELRSSDSPVTLTAIDAVLRTIQCHSQDMSQPLPDLFAVRVEQESITAFLGSPADLPAPFTEAHGDRTIWAAAVADIRPPARIVAAPYPALCTIGADQNGGTLLVNLEYLGQTAITGDERMGRFFLNAVITELASSPWSEGIRISLHALHGDLGRRLDPSRVHEVTNPEEFVAQLRQDLSVRAAVFERDGHTHVNEARVRSSADELWPSRILLLGTSADPELTATLADLLGDDNFGFLLLGQSDHDRLSAGIHFDGSAAQLHLPEPSVPPIPFRPQQLSDREVELLEQLFATTTESSELAAPSETRHDLAISTADELAPRLGLLGPVELTNLEDPEALPGRGAELAAFLSLNAAVEGRRLQKAFWPDTVDASNNQRQLATKLRVALGHAPDGRLLLPENSDHHGYVLDPAVRSDWDDFRALTGTDLRSASMDDLVDALGLVRGQPFEGCNTRRWWQWIAIPQEEMIASILDCAHEVAERALTGSDHAVARFAAHVAQSVDPLNEAGWRIDLQVALQAGDRAAFQTVLDEIYQRVGGGDPDYELDKLTQELVDAFTPAGSTVP